MTTPADNPPPTNPPAAMPGATGAVAPGPAGVPTTPAAEAAADPAAGGSAVPTVPVATYPDYALAQQAVDYLSDNQFPVEKTSIVGTDLRLVENVLGRMTTVRAALAGAASGAWFGLFIGLFIGLFVGDANWFGLIFLGLLIGGAWGAVFGAIAQAMTGGRRDFTSRSSLQASQYAVVVEADVADGARQLLTRLNWQNSGAR